MKLDDDDEVGPKRARKHSEDSNSKSSCNQEDNASEDSVYNISSLGSSNDTQLLYDDYDDDDEDQHSAASFVDTTLDQSRPSLFEHDSILFPKAKLIDYLSNSASNQLLLMQETDEMSVLASNEPKKESKKEKKLVKAIDTGNIDEEETIRLTLMSLEVHVNTNSNLTPNPDSDHIGFVTYSIFQFCSSDMNSNQPETHLVIVLDPKVAIKNIKRFRIK